MKRKRAQIPNSSQFTRLTKTLNREKKAKQEPEALAGELYWWCSKVLAH